MRIITQLIWALILSLTLLISTPTIADDGLFSPANGEQDEDDFNDDDKILASKECQFDSEDNEEKSGSECSVVINETVTEDSTNGHPGQYSTAPRSADSPEDGKNLHSPPESERPASNSLNSITTA